MVVRDPEKQLRRMDLDDAQVESQATFCQHSELKPDFQISQLKADFMSAVNEARRYLWIIEHPDKHIPECLAKGTQQCATHTTID